MNRSRTTSLFVGGLLAAASICGCGQGFATCDLPAVPAGISSVVAPAYPADALAAGTTGSVVVEVRVRQSGSVASISVGRSSGNNELDQSALSGARRSTYRGGLQGCSTVAPGTETVDYTATFNGETATAS